MDNGSILKHCDKKKDAVLKTLRYPSPIVIVPASATEGETFLAAAICAGYSKAPASFAVEVAVEGPGEKKTLTVLPIEPKDVRHLMV